MVQPVHKRLADLIKLAHKFLQDPKNKKYKLHSVEIVGGGSRIPEIQDIISKIFGMKCSKTVKPTECIARGCSVASAMERSTFRVAEYKFTEHNIFPIKCSW